jgi:hypothetical protein
VEGGDHVPSSLFVRPCDSSSRRFLNPIFLSSFSSFFVAQGYPGKHYCPRMATMNKPTYAAIVTHSPNKPVLVFVSSRRQTRLTGTHGAKTEMAACRCH